ncbi:MAG: SDR family oxidoreductase [Planctomycetes bacterium]|nr:SDR family oxidoreductase [Planctomycetota bacterium]
MEKLEQKLKGRVALVTGSARGLGRAYALRLARLGADVVINDIRLDAAKEFDEELTADTVMDECKALGVRSIGIEADVSKKDQVEAMARQIVDELGSLDILVNNAGGMLRPAETGHASTMTEDDLRFTLDINLMSTIFCCQAAAGPMKKRGWGRMVNVASQAAVGGWPAGVHYGIAKAGVVRYTRSLATELGPHGINVNCIAPALILSSRALVQDPHRKDAGPRIPLRRVGVPEDCAKVIEFFCTDLSDYVTGQCLAVCGGLCMTAT